MGEAYRQSSDGAGVRMNVLVDQGDLEYMAELVIREIRWKHFREEMVASLEEPLGAEVTDLQDSALDQLDRRERRQVLSRLCRNRANWGWVLLVSKRRDSIPLRVALWGSRSEDRTMRMRSVPHLRHHPKGQARLRELAHSEHDRAVRSAALRVTTSLEVGELQSLLEGEVDEWDRRSIRNRIARCEPHRLIELLDEGEPDLETIWQWWPYISRRQKLAIRERLAGRSFDLGFVVSIGRVERDLGVSHRAATMRDYYYLGLARRKREQELLKEQEKRRSATDRSSEQA